jgi:alanyl-tRNA synthetase
MKSDELRRAFLDYFREKGHVVVPSSSLVPETDPTLLFTIAGMVQFKQYYASKGAIPFTRAVTVQKCLRAADLEEVGKTVKHHTFFEMLGNFSFGDYFKEEAITWGWDFLVRVVGLPMERLHVTVYEDDDESEKIWKAKIGVKDDRFSRLGKETNFWGPAGATGACGPCSEIHYDRGGEFGCKGAHCSPACSCDRFIEVWNLVFPQFYMGADGRLSPLERRGVDTGMGLDRLSMVAQGVESNYDTDLFKPIMRFIKEEAGCDTLDPVRLTNVRVIADHARALCFAISEGVLPSNEGRGYVIRRILRRAVVKSLDLGVEEAFVFKVAGAVIDVMRGPYPELAEQREKIAIIIKSDEERFERTLSRGMGMFKDIAGRLSAAGSKVIPGTDVFQLYDTYGFPVEITRDLAETHGLEADIEGFEREMESQRVRARMASKLGKELECGADVTRAPDNFVGYDTLEVPTVISSLSGESGKIRAIGEKGEAEVELERTPFYPEGGGQVGDVGLIIGNSGRGLVTEVRWLGGSRISHRVIVEKGTLTLGEGVVAKVDVERRRATQRNHTATHLLHAALRSTLGGHVRQSGSLVAPDRLRFDFTHYEPLADLEIRAVEDIVNGRILDNTPVVTGLEAFEEAKRRGAIALFGEKYGEDVRVVEIESASCELCGGTHVRSTGDLGSFRIIWESGIAAGTRRIEAVTGHVAIDVGREASRGLERVASILKLPVRDLEEGSRRMVERLKTVERQVGELRERVAGSDAGEILKAAREVAGIRVVAARVDAPDLEVLKHLVDKLQAELPNGVVCLGSRIEDRAAIIVSVSQELASGRNIKASLIAKKLGEMVGGRGGGKDSFAQAGGKSPEMLDDALSRCAEVIAGLAR